MLLSMNAAHLHAELTLFIWGEVAGSIIGVLVRLSRCLLEGNAAAMDADASIGVSSAAARADIGSLACASVQIVAFVGCGDGAVGRVHVRVVR